MPMFHGMGIMQIGWTVRPFDTENFHNVVPDYRAPGVQRSRADGLQTPSARSGAYAGVCHERCHGHQERLHILRAKFC